MAETTVRAWDLPTRIFHWALVICILSAWFSFEYAAAIGDPQLKWHRWNGKLILVLLTWRLLWGFVGGTTSRFVNFVRWPWDGLGYLLARLRGEKPKYLGHNPAGAWMVLILLVAVAIQAKLGLFTLEHNEITAGPLQRTIMENEALTKTIQIWHGRGFNILIGLIAIHIAVNAIYQFILREKLIPAMVTGRKPGALYLDHHEAQGGSLALAAGLFVVAAGIVYGAIIALGGRIVFFA